MDLSAFSLEGKSVIVTGANTGIGQGIALAIGRAGGNVIGVGRSSMDETAAAFAPTGGQFHALKADLSDHKAAQAMVDEAFAAHGPIAGVVVRIKAQEGQQVKADDPLLVLEAMRMETSITSPFNGTLKKIRVATGDSVQGGQVLVDFV